MIRSLLVVISVCCVATVLSQALGAAYLWSRGQLTAEVLQDVRMILAGEEPDIVDINEEDMRGQPSREQVVAERSMRVLELNTRQTELTALKNMITRNREDVSQQQQLFQKEKNDFEARLHELQDNNTSESVEQTRGIVLTLSPADKVNYLMALDVEQCIVLLKGMPEKEIGKILQEFSKREGDVPKRGQTIFEAIYQGEPTGIPIEETLDRLTQDLPVPRS